MKKSNNESKIVLDAKKAIAVRKKIKAFITETDKSFESITKTKTQIDEAKDAIKNDIDSLSEMGEMESLRLQMAMDRMSKFITTLSNLLKKISDTSSSIIQNLK